MSESPAETQQTDDHHDHGYAHVMPMKILIGVCLALMALTAITVAQSTTLDKLGWKAAELIAAMIIATIKAGLVALFFMHLKYDKPLNIMIVTFSLIFVALFLGFAMMDTWAYRADVEALEKKVTP